MVQSLNMSPRDVPQTGLETLVLCIQGETLDDEVLVLAPLRLVGFGEMREFFDLVRQVAVIGRYVKRGGRLVSRRGIAVVHPFQAIVVHFSRSGIGVGSDATIQASLAIEHLGGGQSYGGNAGRFGAKVDECVPRIWVV